MNTEGFPAYDAKRLLQLNWLPEMFYMFLIHPDVHKLLRYKHFLEGSQIIGRNTHDLHLNSLLQASKLYGKFYTRNTIAASLIPGS